MMTGNEFVNGLQLYKGQFFSGLTDDNMLANALLKKPHEMGTLVSYAFGVQDDGYKSTLDFITGGLGNVMTIENNWYDWSFIIEADRAVTIRKAMWNGIEVNETTTTATPGLNGTPIKLWLEDKWFGPGTIIEFDEKQFQGRISGEAYQDGDDWVYTVYTTGETAQSGGYIPPRLLAPMSQVSRAGSAYEEYSEEADILNYNTPFKLRNTLTTMRLDYNITGSAYSTYLAIQIEDPKTRQKTYYWATYQDWKAMREWVKRIDYQLMHDQFTADGFHSKGTNGRTVFRGAGVRQQISPANKRYYSDFNLGLVEDFLFDLSYNILGTSERKFLALTGEMGMLQFDKAVKKEVAQLTLLDTVFVTGSNMALNFGNQFTTYKMPQGIEFTVQWYPPYDELVHNRKLHPVTLKPLESYRYTILDIGRRDGKANIIKVVRKDRGFVQWYTGGSVAPNGYAKDKNTLRSNAKDGYEIHFLGEMGIMLRDPRACGELIMDID